MAPLSACRQRAAPTFKGIDITGAAFGRTFSLPDADGARRNLEDFRGKAVMMFFGFTQCPDVCPTALRRAVEARRLLGAAGDKVQVVFVTVDPSRDTPEVLKAYVAAFDSSFVALRGDAEATAAMATEFKAFFQKVPTPSSYTIDHTAFTYLFDPQGRLRVALRHEQTAQDFAADLKTPLDESVALGTVERSVKQ